MYINNIANLDTFHNTHSATELQCECLLKLKLGNLHSILENFVQWRRDGMFDFCELPLTMKKHLEHEDEESIAAIHDVYSGKYC